MEPAPQNSNSAATETVKQDARREILDLVKLAVMFLIIFWLVKSFVVEGYEVQGDSMSPTLNDRDRILVFKLPHELSRLRLFRAVTPFRENNIIVFEGERDKRFVKRIIAFNPSQTNNTVDAKHLDSTEETSYVKVEFDNGIVRVNDWQIDESGYLPETELKVRGADVRMLGPGEYYVLGDHRNISKDSRSFSAVSDKQIIGRAILRFWPLSQITLL